MTILGGWYHYADITDKENETEGGQENLTSSIAHVVTKRGVKSDLADLDLRPVIKSLCIFLHL